VPWWAIAASIVATETSTITFISVPGVAFARGGNFQFLQLVLGYMLGRIVISVLFIPSYFRGELLTVYQLLERRFGQKIKMLAAALFVVMRNIADGVRLLLTAIVLAAVYTAFQPQASVETIIVWSIVLLGVVMIVFTYFGGMEAVIWVEVVQLGIYLAGALAAALVLAAGIKGGFGGAMALGREYGKFSMIDLGFRWTEFTVWSPTSFWQALPFSNSSHTFNVPFDLKKTYTLWAGLIGGCFLTMSTHGTDQYLVQRYLCTDRPRRAAQALLSSGAVVLAQFIGFLFIGVLLFAFYGPHSDPAYGTLTAGAATLPLEGAFRVVPSDAIFPHFITRHMPSGLSVLLPQLHRGDRRQRSLPPVRAAPRRPPLPARLPLADARVGDCADCRRHLLHAEEPLGARSGALRRVADQRARARGLPRRHVLAPRLGAARARRHVHEHRRDALRALHDAARVDVVRAARQRRHVPRRARARAVLRARARREGG
jgi:Na+/proline symporter